MTDTSRRRKRQWGETPANIGISGINDDVSLLRKSRFSTAPPTNSDGDSAAPLNDDTNGALSSNDPRARAAALQASIQARLAALKARTALPTATILQNGVDRKRPALGNELSKDTKKRARVFELDMSDTAPTRLIEKQERDEQLRLQPLEKVNPYLAHTTHTAALTSGEAIGAAPNSDTLVQETILIDSRLAGGHIAKQRLKSRPINFITPGTYIALGEKKRQLAARAEESGYISGRKDGRVIQSVGMGVGVVALIDDNAVVVQDAGKEESYYGVGEAGKLIDERLPARIDAPEWNVEDYAVGGKKYHKFKQLSGAWNEQLQFSAVDAAIHDAESAMPYALEWWDAELLPSKLRKELAAEEGKLIASKAKKQASAMVTDTDKKEDIESQQMTVNERRQKMIERCYKHAALTNSKTHSLLQHPIPILSASQKAAVEALKNKPPTLHLTKAERKRHRKLRRAERLREQQDMQAAGLIPPPEPRLTLSNYMKVLGDQAILDPSKMEARVMEQINQRKMKHEKMNQQRKLTKDQRAEKYARKLAEDVSTSVSVALFWVKDMSHPYHRAKVDLNAQQNNITGGVLECDQPGGENLVLVIAEGGEKAIKRFVRLMTIRMKWKGEDFLEEEEEEEEELMVGDNDDEIGQETRSQRRKKFNPNNTCELIWTGMAVKRAFHSFMFQSAPSSTVARKILEAKGVAHYWDLVVGHVQMKESVNSTGVAIENLKFRLGDDKE